MSLDIAQIRHIALHQQARQVDTVEFKQATTRIRITMRNNVRTVVQEQDETSDAQASLVATPSAKDDVLTVKSDKLGIVRMAHPLQPSQAIKEGDRVVAGQTMFYLEVDLSLLAVDCPHNGVLHRMFVNEGVCVDYGMPLFDIVTTD
jgi:biotin carboxyl carrier protein